MMQLFAWLVVGLLQRGHALDEKLCAAETYPQGSTASGLIQASRHNAVSEFDERMLGKVQKLIQDEAADPPPAWNKTCRAAFDVHPALPANAVRDLKNPGMKWWYDIPRGQQLEKVKLGFVMLVKSNFGNLNAWKKWLERGRRDGVVAKFLVFEYGMDRDAEKFSSILATWPEEFRSGLHARKEQNAWCKMFTPYITLAAELLQDPEVSYVFTWDGSHGIPTKSLLYIQRSVEKDPRTRFCADWSWGYVRSEGTLAMHRADLEVFLWKEHATQNQTAAIARNFERLKQQFPWFENKGACEDEISFALPLLLRELHEKIYHPKRHTTNPGLADACHMYSDWRLQDGDCTKQKPWGSNVAYCNGCDTLKQSPLKYSGSYAHPATYAKVSRQAYLELWRSQFWFARKMVDGAIDDDAAAVAGMGDEDGYGGLETSLEDKMKRH